MAEYTEETESYEESSESPESSGSSYAESSDSPVPVPGINVRYSATTPSEHPPIYAYALKVEVVSAIDYPDHIFVFHRGKENAMGDNTDEFIQIASPLDVEEVPENAPDLLNNMPYYRSKEVTLWFRNYTDLELAKAKIRDDIKILVNTYDILYNCRDQEQEEHYERN